MTDITPETRLRRSAELLSADIDGETVIMSVETGRYHSLDMIGGDIWSRLEQQTTAATLAESLARDYDAPRDTIERDILALLTVMSMQGLLIIEE